MDSVVAKTEDGGITIIGGGRFKCISYYILKCYKNLKLEHHHFLNFLSQAIPQPVVLYGKQKIRLVTYQPVAEHP